MAAEQTKKTVMALVAEVTEGTPVKPTAGTQYIALQDGFDIEPAFEVLENAEFTGSIGQSKPILGLENPSVTLNHYIRHSGVEGQEPNYKLLLQGAFGAKSVASVEFNTVAGSTAGTATAAATINVDTGEGATFERGEALLIKDGANGYKIRNIKSISGDTLTLNFNLGTAPGVGVDLGKAVLYKPGESHPSFSVWNFRGNGTAMELVSGAKVSEMSIEIAAGELINGSFTLAGVEYFFDPIDIITATNNVVDFVDDGGTKQALVATGTYKDPHDLAAAVEAAMDAVSVDEITVVYNDLTGKFTISSDGSTTFSLLWNTGAGAANTIGNLLGFNTAADDTGAFTYTADSPISLSSFQTAAFDDADPLVAKANEVFLGDFADNVCFEASSLTFSMTNTPTNILSVCADSGKSATLMTSREVTVEFVATYEKYDADKFKRFRTNEDTAFAFNFGTKSGGNWVAGKCGNIYLPTATISSFKIGDGDGIITIEGTLSAFVDAGLGEVYLNFL